MDKQNAVEILTSAIPESGAVTWESVHNALQSTPGGRAAIQYFHAARRDKNVPIYAKVDRKSRALMVSRQPFPAEPTGEHEHVRLDEIPF